MTLQLKEEYQHHLHQCRDQELCLLNDLYHLDKMMPLAEPEMRERKEDDKDIVDAPYFSDYMNVYGTLQLKIL